MFSKYRKGLRKQADDLDNLLATTRTKYYIERNYEKMPLFKYLLFLRKNKVNLNAMFDEYIRKEEETKNSEVR